MIRCGDLVQPLIHLLREELLATGLVQCDETRFPVLKEPGKAPTSHAYLWALRSPEQPLVSYEYDPSRSGQVPLRLLEGFQGILQTDGYEGYAAVGSRPGIVHAGCWAHARRKFVEALEAQGGKKQRASKDSIAGQGLGFVQQLYAIEREAKQRSPAERTQIRQERSQPVLTELRRWLEPARSKVPPQSLTGKALAYLAGQWPKLARVLEDGRIPLDTNLVENAIRPFVVGRKNWLFADTVRGAQASANLYSLVETAKASELEPFAYLRHVFAELPKATTLAEIEALLPHRLDRSRLQDPRQAVTRE
jgi:transposase